MCHFRGLNSIVLYYIGSVYTVVVLFVWSSVHSASNRRISIRIYSQDPTEAGQIADRAMRFMWLYVKLATVSAERGRHLFAFRPKGHYFHHLILRLRAASLSGHPCLSPLAYSCSAAEDFIGRASMLSRRVNARTVQTRVLERYLAGASYVWSSHEV